MGKVAFIITEFMQNRRSFIETLGISSLAIGLSKPSFSFARQLITQPIPNLKNPLIDEPGMSDPHALVTDDAVYMFTGHDVGFGIPDWVMPDWRIFRSENLQSREHVGTISPEDNYMGKGNTNCWAGYSHGDFFVKNLIFVS
jgi:hypothetical protein